MAESISLNLSAKIKNGPAFAVHDVLEVDGYDKVSISVPASDGITASSVTAEIFPATLGTGTISFLSLKSSFYGTELEVAVGAATAVSLDKPQLYLGLGSVEAMAGSVDFNEVTFSSLHTEAIDLELFVGRSVPLS